MLRQARPDDPRRPWAAALSLGLGIGLMVAGALALRSIGDASALPLPPTPTAAPPAMETYILLLASAPGDEGGGLRAGSGSAREARVATYWALEAAGRARIAALEAPLRRLEQAGEISDVETFPAMAAVALRASLAATERLADLPGVVAIQRNRWHPLEAPLESHAFPVASEGWIEPAADAWHLDLVHAREAWRAFGTTGEGAVVAVLDTGADWQHPLLIERYRGRDAREHDYHWLDATGDSGTPRPVDPHGHGSHVTGLVAGRQGPEAWGVAPGAQWIAARVFDGGGRSSDLWLLRGAAWTLAPTRLDGSRPRPDLAPDVVNGSWSLENGADPLLDRMIERWRALGIVPVFAAGNIEDGADLWGRVLAPASHPEVLAVGAATRGGQAWPYSRGGPGFHDRVKPDLLAPGVGLRSAAPGGGMREGSGSSMAGPQVAGAAALLRSLAPDLDVSAICDLLRESAADRGVPGPDGQSGWGLLDLPAAMAAAADVGLLSGQVRDPGGTPEAGTEVLASAPGEDLPRRRVLTGDTGSFRLTLPSGEWQIQARRPDADAGPLPVSIEAGAWITRDLQLELGAPAAQARISGRVTDLDGVPLPGARIALEGSSWEARSGPDGRYGLALRPGAHTLRAEISGRRAITTRLGLAAGELRDLDFALPRAPRLLLVEADAWDGERIAPYLLRALDDAGYAAERWSVDQLAALPSAAELSAYEIVIWAHVYGSPGLIDRRRADAGQAPAAVPALTTYAARGGRLILSGQDITLHDLQRGQAPDYLNQIFGVGLERSRSWTEATRVQGEAAFAGIALDLAWPRGAPKLRYFEPDALSAVDAAAGRPLLRYADGELAALAREAPDGRSIFLGFGPETAGGRLALARLFDAAIAWLEAPELQLAVDQPAPAPAEPLRFELRLRAGRSTLPVAIEVELPETIELLSPGQLQASPAGRLIWSGPLPSGTSRELSFQARLRRPLPPGASPVVEAHLLAAGRSVTEALALRPPLPDLRPSRLALQPARFTGAAPVALRLDLMNAGAAAAPATEVELLLPDGLRPLTPSLGVSVGRTSWSPDARALRWQAGDLGSGATASLRLRLQPEPGLSAATVLARIADETTGLITRSAGLRQGGPELSITRLRLLPDDLAAGEAFTLSLQARNDGDEDAAAGLSLDLPPSLEPLTGPVPPGEAWPAWRGSLPAGGAIDLDLPLRSRPEALRGQAALTLTLDDGAWPAAPITRSLSLALRRPDLSATRATLQPAQPRAGEALSLTILVANHGDAPASVRLTDTLAPAFTPLGSTLEHSLGQVESEPGVLRWAFELPPAEGDYRSLPAAPDAPMPPAGRALPQPGPDGISGPVDLGMAFPFYTEVYTQAWISDAGWLAFEPPAAVERPSLGDGGPGVASIAVLWRDSRPSAEPWLRSLPGGATLGWTIEGRRLASVSLGQSGEIGLRYAPGEDPAAALVGLRSPAGSQRLLLPEDLSVTGADLLPPGGWAWLRYQSRISTASELNRRLGHTIQLSSPGDQLLLEPKVRINPSSLAESRLDVWPEHPLAGSGLVYTLSLAAEGRVPAREVEALVELPSAASLDPASLSPGLRYDAATHALVWRGQLDAGERRPLHWRMRLDPALRSGARAVATARIKATGLSALRLRQDLRVQASGLHASRKQVSRAVASAGQTLRFELRLRNAGTAPVEVEVRDRLPEGLRFLPGSLRASSGSAPVWDAERRELGWAGSVPGQGELRLGLDAEYAGQNSLTNYMLLHDADGHELVDWASVAPAVSARYLPLLQP